MAIGHLHATVVQRSAGQSAVSAAAYASRSRMVDARTGVIYDYSSKHADVMFSFVGLPDGAPDSLRDPAALSNALEARETRKNSQTARKFIMALPSELTPQQQEWLVKDFGRENFTRKGLAYHVAIHKPHAYGDQRNVHAHWTVATRVMERGVFTAKDRESNSKGALLAWRDNWEKLVNRQLERHGHTARISMKSLQDQGIDRTPQIHLGQGASALERKGRPTDRGALLRDIANDNRRGPQLVVDNSAAQETAPEPEAELIDRDAQDAAWQEAVESAGIRYAEEQRRQFFDTQARDRAAFERNAEAMLARQAASWGEIMQQHSAQAASLYQHAIEEHQPGTMEEAVEGAGTGASFLLSLFTSWAESMTGGTARRRPRGMSKAKQEQMRQAAQQKEAQARELEAVLQEQSREREQYDRRRAQMLFQQQAAVAAFEQRQAGKSSLQQAFEVHTEIIDAGKKQSEDAARLGPRVGHDLGGPELGE